MARAVIEETLPAKVDRIEKITAKDSAFMSL
jgi:hypothetical protein